METRVLEHSMIFTKKSVNLFTDASVKGTDVIAGVEGLVGYDHISNPNEYVKLTNSTNNEGEIYAIWLALNICIQLKDTYDLPFVFNIFSDSKISIFGLRKWYEEWLKNAKALDINILLNSSGKEVANQQVFLRCMDIIIKNKLRVNLYHICGHINPNNKSDYMRFVDDFNSANDLDILPSRELVEHLVFMNSIVDKRTREYLTIEGIKLKREFMFNVNPLKIADQIKKYSDLINKS